MPTLTADGLRDVAEIAERNGVSVDAATMLLNALAPWNGAQAQFNHPELGGMGQWSTGGMVMIGDMFNNELKRRVDRLCRDLAEVLSQNPLAKVQSQRQTENGNVGPRPIGSHSEHRWWPHELGSPASVGAQNEFHYAYFPNARRLAIQKDSDVHVYETGEHEISGFSQAQSGSQSLTFTSQLGLGRVSDLRLATGPGKSFAETVPTHDRFRSEIPATASSASETTPQSTNTGTQLRGDAIFAAIERLADLRQKNILTDEEFAAKKRELLNRL